MPKYKFVNGVMQLAEPASAASSVATPKPSAPPLAVVCNPDDILEATVLQAQHGRELKIPEATVVALGQFEDPAFVDKYKASNLDGEAVLGVIGRKFAQYGIPVGMLPKLLRVSDYENINVVLDDSYSMNSETDSTVEQASEFMREYFAAKGAKLSDPMTRWEEEEDRLHVMIEMLMYIPSPTITIWFMNRSDFARNKNILTIKRDGRTPEALAAYAHAEIRKLFTAQPDAGTPTMRAMQESFRRFPNKTLHYLFTDGVPGDCTTDALGTYLASRPNPERSPITFVSCTNVDDEAKWMKKFEEEGPWMSEIDDFKDERDEVLHDQGSAFPYTKGLWLMCLLVGAINPDDLDKLDDENPLSKKVMDDMQGRVLTTEEYDMYLKAHPKGPGKTASSGLGAAFSKLGFR